MFDNFHNVLNIDLSNFISSNVKYMYRMFYGCMYLTSLNLDNFDTSSVTNMGFTFHYCRSLRNLNLRILHLLQIWHICSVILVIYM